VSESEAQDVKKEPLTVANDPTKRWRGGKGTQQRMDERMNYAYACMLEGGTRRQVLQKVMDRFSVSEVTAGRDYSAAMALLKTEQIETRENLLNQIQALRLATVQKALRKGQLQTVAMLLKDMGAVIGEAAPEQQAAAAPTLNITVEDKRQAWPLADSVQQWEARSTQNLPMTNTERASFGYLVACGAIVAALVAMGIDNNRQLERCEAAGRSAAECRLVVLGR
jgi:hypothetical protein